MSNGPRNRLNFDSAGASLREVPAPLRMTVLGKAKLSNGPRNRLNFDSAGTSLREVPAPLRHKNDAFSLTDRTTRMGGLFSMVL